MSSSPEQFVSLGWDNGHYLYIYPLLRKLIYMFSVCWGEKVTTQIVILQMQPEFSKIPSIPVCKTATDCTVTMETCSGFGSWFSDQKMPGSLHHGGDRVSLRGRPLEIQHQWRPSRITRSGLFTEKTFTASTSLIFRRKLGKPIEAEWEKSLMLLLDFQKYFESWLWSGNPRSFSFS